MNEDNLDPKLAALFASAHRAYPSEAYTDRVMARIDKARSRTMVVGIVCSVLLAVIAVPAHEVALHIAEILLVPLIQLDDSLLAELLVPLNSVGAILSIVIVLMRIAHRKLF